MLDFIKRRKKPIELAVESQIDRKFPEPPKFDSYYAVHEKEWENEVAAYELELSNYKDRTEQLSVLNEIQNGSKEKLNPNTILSTVVWGIGLLVVLNYEKFEVIRGKAFTLLPKIKI